MVVGSATMGLFDALSKWRDGPEDSGPVGDARPVGTKEEYLFYARLLRRWVLYCSSPYWLGC